MMTFLQQHVWIIHVSFPAGAPLHFLCCNICYLSIRCGGTCRTRRGGELRAAVCGTTSQPMLPNVRRKEKEAVREEIKSWVETESRKLEAWMRGWKNKQAKKKQRSNHHGDPAHYHEKEDVTTDVVGGNFWDVIIGVVTHSQETQLTSVCGVTVQNIFTHTAAHMRSPQVSCLKSFMLKLSHKHTFTISFRIHETTQNCGDRIQTKAAQSEFHK